MPTTLPFSGARIPNQNEAGDPSADFARFGGDIDDKLVLKATSQSDRDTKYANVTKDTLVSCSALGVLWQKTTSPPTAPAWKTLAEVGTPVTSGVGIARSGFTISSQWGQRLHGVIYWRARLTWGGSTVTAGTGGNLAPDLLAFSLNTAFQPASGVADWPLDVDAAVTTAVGHIDSSGDVYITSLSSGGSIGTGGTVFLSSSYPGA